MIRGSPTGRASTRRCGAARLSLFFAKYNRARFIRASSLARSERVNVPQPNQQEAHLIVAAIRLLIHREGAAPRPEAIAEFLGMASAVLRIQLVALQDLGILALLESAYDTHVEIRDHRLIEELSAGEDAGDLSRDLAEFDRRKQEEAARMEKLFSEGDHERKQAERLEKMDAELRDFRKKKPRNPFDEK